MESNLALSNGITEAFRIRPQRVLPALPPLPKPPSVPFIILKAFLLSALLVGAVLFLVQAGFAAVGPG